MEMSNEVNEIFAALSIAQQKIEGAAKESETEQFKKNGVSGKYADLLSVWTACREHLTAQGLSVMQGVDTNEGSVVVSTMLGHKSGQWVRSSIAWEPSKTDPQGVGSLITYLRRYGLAAMVGVAPMDEDDDATKSMGRPQQAKMPPKAETATQSDADLDDAAMLSDLLAELAGANTGDELDEIAREAGPLFNRLPHSDQETIKNAKQERLDWLNKKKAA